MNEVAPLNCTYYPNGKHVWEFKTRNAHSDIYQCACNLQQSTKHGEKPYGIVGRKAPDA